MILLTPLDLSLGAVLVLSAGALTHALRLAQTQALLIASARTVVQLLLVGLVLKALFANVHLGWVGLMSVVMLAIAGREAMVRSTRRLSGFWGFGIGTLTMFLSSFSVTILALTLVIGPSPWYTPQYAIPLLGMVLGNTMTGVALGVDRLTQSAWDRRDVIEARLILGQGWAVAIGDLRRDSLRAAMIPTINAMAAAGVVSLPGMMTGQILAGTPPVEAVKYQILIMFLITSGTIFGTTGAVWLSSRRLFDVRERLRLDRLSARR